MKTLKNILYSHLRVSTSYRNVLKIHWLFKYILLESHIDSILQDCICRGTFCCNNGRRCSGADCCETCREGDDDCECDRKGRNCVVVSTSSTSTSGKSDVQGKILRFKLGLNCYNFSIMQISQKAS